jgi:hypothetical protein
VQPLPQFRRCILIELEAGRTLGLGVHDCCGCTKPRPPCTVRGAFSACACKVHEARCMVQGTRVRGAGGNGKRRRGGTHNRLAIAFAGVLMCRVQQVCFDREIPGLQ